jgi:hypothetical protein
MNLKLSHHFLTASHDVGELFEGVHLLSQFKKKLEAQASRDPSRYPFEQYLGDGFEFLVELIIKLSPVDNRIGIVNYEPVKNNHDNGVDGYGINLKGNRCAIQVKYRGDSTRVLTSGEDRLDSFVAESVLEGVYPEKEGKIKNHYIFTTARGLHHYTDEHKFRGSVKCFGNEELREILDNNHHFWNACRQVIEENIGAK